MIELPYGSERQSASPPDFWSIVPLAMSDPPSGGQSERDLVFEALQHPIASPRLGEFLERGDRVVIIISDKTRKCRTELFLPLILDVVRSAGIADEDVTIVFANGTHPPQKDEEIRAIIGEDIYHGYRILENHAREDEHVLIGTTRFGTAIELHRAVAEADKVIAAGTIVHHYFAGYGGGAKLFMPGVASYKSAVTNHRRTLTEGGYFHSGCRDGLFDGNPVAEDIWDAVRFFPPTFYFGTILDSSGSVAHAVCGNLREAHLKGCGIVDKMYSVPILEKADCVIVSPGGHPKDINLIQTHKSLHHASYAVKDGGVIICLAECSDGIGNPSFMKWFDYEDDDDLRAAVLRDYVMNAHTAVALRDKCRRFHVLLVSALDAADVQSVGMTPVSSLEAAIEAAKPHLTATPSVYTIDNGFLLVPMERPS